MDGVQILKAGDRATWLSLRRQDVTASAAGALLDVHPWLSRFKLWASKAGRLMEDPEETAPMRRGRLLEPVAVALLKEEKPRWRIKHNTGRSQVYYRHPDLRIGATPDVLATFKGRLAIVQIKSVERSIFRSKWTDEDGETRPPLWIVVQALIEAHLTGAQDAYVAPLVVGHGIDLELIKIPIHEGAWMRVKEEVEAFWRSIAAGEAPEPDYERDGQTLSELFAEDDGTEIDLSEDSRFLELIQRRADLKRVIKESELRLEPIEAEIVHRIGKHERAYVPGWRVSRPLTQRRDRITGAVTMTRQLRIREG